MTAWGGMDAKSLKNAIDNIFLQKERKILLINYQSKLISLTTDGDSANTRHTFGLMTRMATERNWLVKIHCTHYKVQAGVKGCAFK